MGEKSLEEMLEETLSLEAPVEYGFAPLVVGSPLGRVLFQPLILAADDTGVIPGGRGQGGGLGRLPGVTEPKPEM